MGMNVNRNNNVNQADSTRVHVNKVYPEKMNKNDSIFTQAKAHKNHNTTQAQAKTEQKGESKFREGARVLLNVLSDAFLPQGTPSAGNVLLPTDEDNKNAANNKILHGGKLSQEDKQNLANKYSL